MTSALMWGSILMLTIITAIWVTRMITPVQADLSRMDADLQALSAISGEACNSYEYDRRYNPRTNNGNLSFTNYSICIVQESYELCTYSVCNLGLTLEFDLASFTYLTMSKRQGDEPYAIRIE
jgi:hypothetical protein